MGKWKYASNLDAFVTVQDGTAGNVWLYKPIGWVDSGTNTADTTPDAFSFGAASNVATGSTQTSNAITVAGINAAAAISVSGGSYSVGCNGSFSTLASTITNGQTVCVQHTAAASNASTVSTQLTIGGVSATFSSTTVAAPSTGTLTVTLNVAGAPSNGAAGNYGVTVNCSTPAASYNGTITLAGSATSGSTNLTLPAGSSGCTLAQGAIAAAPTYYSWAASNLTQPASGALAGGSNISGSINASLVRNTVAVTVSKTITGAPASAIASEMSFGYTLTCSDPASNGIGNVVVTAGSLTGTTASVNLAAGSTGCTLTETSKPAAPSGYSWGATSYSQPPATLPATGSVVIGISNALNTAVATPAMLTVSKSVSGAPAAGAPGSYGFTVSCATPTATYNGSVALTGSATSGSSAAISIAAGSTNCTVAETTRPNAPTGYAWAATSYSQPPVLLASGATATASMSGALTAVSSTDNLAALRAQIRSAPEGSWVKVNTNLFSDAWVPKNLRPNQGSSSNPHAIINAWSSFAWDSKRGDLVIFGGGHANYSGNEVYRWRGSTLQWERLSLPSALDTQSVPVGGAEYAPMSSHTYDNQLYLPVVDRFVTFGGAAQPSGGPFQARNADGSMRYTGPYFFDVTKANANLVGGANGSAVHPSSAFGNIFADVNSVGGYMWQNREAYRRPEVAALGVISFVNGTSDAYVENGKDVVLVGGSTAGGTEVQLAKVTINDVNDPLQDTWQLVGINWTGSGSQGAAAYDPINRLYIKTYRPWAPFVFWDMDKAGPNNRNIHVSTLAAMPTNFVVQGQYGIDYDKRRARMLLWGGGGAVYQLNVGARDGTGWSVYEMLPAPNTAAPAPIPYDAVYGSASGVMGKWKYASNLDVFVALQHIDQGNVWMYKPVGWVDLVPPQ